MKLSKTLTVSVAALVLAACAPRDTTHYFSIDEALRSPQAAEVLNPKIKLYFGKPAPGKVVAAGLISNKKTNAANKTDQQACEWAFGYHGPHSHAWRRAPVRLQVYRTSGVRVPVRTESRPVTERNCFPATGGGEHREVNDQSGGTRTRFGLSSWRARW